MLLPRIEITIMKLNATVHKILIGPSLRLVLDMFVELSNELKKKIYQIDYIF